MEPSDAVVTPASSRRKARLEKALQKERLRRQQAVKALEKEKAARKKLAKEVKHFNDESSNQASESDSSSIADEEGDSSSERIASHRDKRQTKSRPKRGRSKPKGCAKIDMNHVVEVVKFRRSFDELQEANSSGGDSKTLENLMQRLENQARLIAGSPLKSPVRFNFKINRNMVTFNLNKINIFESLNQ